jgi:3-deoxy-D-manno-octulosonic-acid transferase
VGGGAPAAEREGPLLAPVRSERVTRVAGSPWPADEGPLLAAWTKLHARHADARLIVAPLEPTAAHLAPLERWAASAGLRSVRLGADGAEHADVVIVDRVGVLGDLYALADAAFVGGGFHGAGLHSVLEPAAFGAPVLFGPRHANSRDASLLIARGGAVSVRDAASLEVSLARWIDDPVARRAAGDAARAVVREGLGAAERSFALVDALMR